MALQSQVSSALRQTTQELTMRVEAVNLQMLELRESVNRSLQLLRELITVSARLGACQPCCVTLVSASVRLACLPACLPAGSPPVFLRTVGGCSGWYSRFVAVGLVQ